jgi:hypothetical protein
MRIRIDALPLAVSLVLVVSLFGGCAQNKQALRPSDSAKSAVAVRLPPVEAMDVRLRSERPEVPPKLPLSLTDETRDRWLTLFEVTVSPVSAGNLPEKGMPKK